MPEARKAAILLAFVLVCIQMVCLPYFLPLFSINKNRVVWRRSEGVHFQDSIRILDA